MPDQRNPGSQLQEHPLLQKLIAGGATNSMVYWGYVGPSPHEGRINFYTSLNDLSASIEIARDDIIHFEDVPEIILPFGAKVIWVKQDASIGRRFDTRGPDGFAEMVRGRLRMQVPATQIRQQDWDPQCSSCSSPCSTCRTECSVCKSICRVKV